MARSGQQATPSTSDRRRRTVSTAQARDLRVAPKRGWLLATGRYIMYDHDLALVKLAGLFFAALLGMDVASMLGEAIDLFIPFLNGVDIVAMPTSAIAALILSLIVFRIFNVRDKIRYYRYR